MDSIGLTICLQSIEALVCFLFFETVTHSKEEKYKRLIIILGSYVVMTGITVLFNFNAIINIIALLIFQFLFAFTLYKQKMLRSIFLSIIFSLSVAITEVMASSIVVFATGGEVINFSTETYRYVLIILISKTLLFVLLRVLSVTINRHKINELDFAFFLYPIVLLTILIVFARILIGYEIVSNDQILIVLSSSLLLIATITINILQHQSAQKKQELFELKAEKQKQEIESTYFELLEHQNKELQIFVHDTKNHLINIYNLSNDSDKAKEYINNIVKDIDQSNRFGKTSNKLLDLIIEKYNYICEKENIIFKQNIHKSNLEFIADSDLTSIFNNLLDNAIEAAKQSKEKYIELSINQVESMLIVDITNSCDIKPVVRQNNLISTKKDNGLHGIGFKSICKSAKKYGGDVEWDYDSINKKFNVSIIFNI